MKWWREFGPLTVCASIEPERDEHGNQVACVSLLLPDYGWGITAGLGRDDHMPVSIVPRCSVKAMDSWGRWNAAWLGCFVNLYGRLEK